jgi:hypothetical protein
MASAAPASIAEQRLIKRAPDHPLPLGQDDVNYISATFKGIEQIFGVKAQPDLPLKHLPGSVLMRKLMELRRSLRPATPEEREAHGKLSSAILLLDIACSLDADLRSVHK